jgi:hypothetical protein
MVPSSSDSKGEMDRSAFSDANSVVLYVKYGSRYKLC